VLWICSSSQEREIERERESAPSRLGDDVCSAGIPRLALVMAIFAVQLAAVVLLGLLGECFVVAVEGQARRHVRSALRSVRFHEAQQNVTRGSAAQAFGDFSLELRNLHNVQYFGEVDVGGQVLSALYDTGSFELIVLSTLCKDCESGTPIYDQKKSKTFSGGDAYMAKHSFGSGEALGKHGIEAVTVGGSYGPLSASKVPFWQVIDHGMDDIWDKNSAFSAIVGLGPATQTPNMGQNSSDDVFSHDPALLETLGVNAFAICYGRGPGDSAPGWLLVGQSVDAATVASASDFVHVPVVGMWHWAARMTELTAVGPSGVVSLKGSGACQPSCAAIVDSGTSLILAPVSVVDALDPVLGNIKKDCSNLQELPEIHFKLGTESFSLPPAIYVLKRTGYTQEEASVWDSLTGSSPEKKLVSQCVPAIVGMDLETETEGPALILGMPFLRYHYVVFQREPKSLHIARSTAECKPSPPGAPLSAWQQANPPVGGAFSNTSGGPPEVLQVSSVVAGDVRLAPWLRSLVKSPARAGMKTVAELHL